MTELASNALIAAVVAAVTAAAPMAARAAAETPVPQNVLSLSAEATAEVETDLLSIQFSTTKEGNDAQSVQSQLKQALDAALQEVRKEAKPGRVDVRTGNFALYPRHGNKGVMNGWTGTAQLIVEGTDVATIAQLAGRVTTLTISSVNQGLSRGAREKAQAETTAQAIANFRRMAQQYSQDFGFAGYSIREVNVSSDGFGGEQPMPKMMMARAASVEADLPVAAGKATVRSSVSGSVQMTR